MKLFDGGRVPNARRVRIFLAEKGIDVPIVPVDLGKMEHRDAAFLARNPLGRVPVLELDDGSMLTESVAICRYFEELHPHPPLFGNGAKGRALVEMWNRRAELDLYLPIQHAFRHTHPGMAGYETPQVAAWGEANRQRPYLAGDTFSIADITAYVALDFTKPAKITIPDDLASLQRWRAGIAARPSASA